MQELLNHFIGQSLFYTLLAVGIVAFLESLVVVGLLLPGALMMVGFGVLIGSGQLNLYQAWFAGIIGCLLADWVSFASGWLFRGTIHRSKWVHKYRGWLEKTEYALHKHSMLTILLGRFIGPTRPLVPMVAGMLNLSAIKFAIPGLIGALFWPPVYFMPGILTGAAIEIPADGQGRLFKWLLLLLALLIWLALWLCWRAWRYSRQAVVTSRLPAGRWRLLAALSTLCSLALLIALQYHPLMPVYRHLLWQVMVATA